VKGFNQMGDMRKNGKSIFCHVRAWDNRLLLSREKLNCEFSFSDESKSNSGAWEKHIRVVFYDLQTLIAIFSDSRAWP